MNKAFILVLLLFSLGNRAALAGSCPVQYPTSRANGTTAGTAVAGGTEYFLENALISGFACFEQLGSWFPSYITSKNGSSPDRVTVDMAYTYDGTATFSNVVVPTAGTYSLMFRYAFSTGLFPGVEHRPEGIVVNGNTITQDLDFPVTGNFETFETVAIAVPLNAGVNNIQVANQATQSVSRLDSMIVTPGGSNACKTLPAVPAAFTAIENGNNQIASKWAPSVVPAECFVGYYNLYRSTDPSLVPTEDNEVATVVDTNSYVDTTGVCNTPYYYYVEGVDFAGSSTASGRVSASISQCPTVSSAQINAGGPSEAPYVADVDFVGGNPSTNNATIDLSGVSDPAPAVVYASARQGNSTYTLSGFVPNSTHTLRLHFVEPYFSTAGSRTFNISVNQVVVMTDYDVFVAAGNKKNKAVVHERTVNADALGSVTIAFTAVVNQALVNAIEVK
jgi:Malectin domain